MKPITYPNVPGDERAAWIAALQPGDAVGLYGRHGLFKRAAKIARVTLVYLFVDVGRDKPLKFLRRHPVGAPGLAGHRTGTDGEIDDLLTIHALPMSPEENPPCSSSAT